MDRINYVRVILDGVLAGVVINIGEAVFGMLYMNEMKPFRQAHSLPLEPTTTQMILYPLLSFAVGLAAIWLYAVGRPRFGPRLAPWPP